MGSRILVEEAKGGGQGTTFNLGESTRGLDTFCFYILSRLSKIHRSGKPARDSSALAMGREANESRRESICLDISSRLYTVPSSWLS